MAHLSTHRLPRQALCLSGCSVRRGIEGGGEKEEGGRAAKKVKWREEGKEREAERNNGEGGTEVER